MAERAYFDFMGRFWSMPKALLLKILDGDGIVPDLESHPDVRQLKRRPTNALVVKLSHRE
jgi:hypothetical protein